MNANWDSWHVVLEICYIFFFMMIAKVIKEKLGLFKSIVVPTALLAGFLGLIFGPSVTGLIHINLFNTSIPLGLNYDQDFYSNIIFYFMIVGFVSLTLTERQSKQNSKSVDSGIFIVAIYMFQALIGLFTLYFVAALIKPGIFTGLGLFLPLAFASGPGLASAQGQAWDLKLPFGYIQQYGVTLASVGFIVGGVFGVILLNYYIRKYKLKPVKLRDIKGIKSTTVDFSTLNEFNFSDNLLVQFSWVGLIVLITFLISLGLKQALGTEGIAGSIQSTLYGFCYIFGIFLAMSLRGLLRLFEERGHRTKPLIDNYMMHNISSFAFNIMITASVMSIKISSIQKFYVELIALTIVGTIGTLIFITKFGRYLYKENTNEYILAMFGMQTGIAATGVALLRGLDPDLETDTSDNVIVLGSAFAAPLAIPIIAVLAFPLIAYSNLTAVKPTTIFGIQKLFGIDVFNILTPVTLFIYFVILMWWLVHRVNKRRRKITQ